MKTLINNSATGLMIGGAGVFFVCAFAHMPREVAQGAGLMIGAALLKFITAKK